MSTPRPNPNVLFERLGTYVMLEPCGPPNFGGYLGVSRPDGTAVFLLRADECVELARHLDHCGPGGPPTPENSIVNFPSRGTSQDPFPIRDGGSVDGSNLYR